MSSSVGAWPVRSVHWAAIDGIAIIALMWSRLGMPMGVRASSMVAEMSKRPKASTKTPMGAKEPKSIIVPAQSNTAALNRLMSGSVQSKRLAIVSSAMPKAVEAPAPQVTMTIRVALSGASVNRQRSDALA